MMLHIDPKIFPKTPAAFMVGGSIRDMLCGRSPVDYDVAVIGDPVKYARQIAAHTKGRLVEIGKPGQMIIRVVGENLSIDIAEVKDGSIEKDLMARDFTINAMAYDLSAQQLVDPLGSQCDLKNRTIRMISREIFRRDPVRLLRAYRIAAQFGFKIESQTIAAIAKNAALIRQSAGERVRDEFFKMLQCTECYPYLCQMADSDLLFAILPELKDLKDCRPNRHHRFNAFGHTLKAFYHLEKLLISSVKPEKGGEALLNRHIAEAQFPLLKFSILVHDIGKPATQTTDHNGTLHYFGHEHQSSRMAESICRRLKCSNQVTDTIQFLVRHHTRPLRLYSARQEQNATPRAVTRFFMQCGAYVPALLILAAADALGKAEKKLRHNTAFISFLKQLMLDFQNDFRPKASAPPLINGHDLIADFGLKPSPLFKRILDRVEEERVSKQEMTRQEAYDLVSKLIKANGRSQKSEDR